MSEPTGVDVHGAKGAVNWQQVRAADHRFAIVKTSEGATFKDARFQQHRVDARAAGLLVGCYHFARPSRNSADAEAANFLAAYRSGSERPVLDFEDNYAPSGARYGPWVRDWMTRVEAATGKIPLLYSYTSYWRAHGSTDQWFARFPLWLADYDGGYTVPTPWSALSIHQFTSSGSVPGISGRVDVNRFHGSDSELLSFFGGVAPAPQPVPGPVYGPIYSEDHMRPIDVKISTDGSGHGYFDLPGVDPHGVVSVVFNTANPPDSGYKPTPDWARLNVNGSARIVIEEALPSGVIDATVWVVT